MHIMIIMNSSSGGLALSSLQSFRAACLMIVFSSHFQLLLGTIKSGFELRWGMVRDLHKNATYLGVEGQAALFAR